ncbi:hypothetical protein [Acinetobacter sp.]|uniref:hypothetical protein n=1 Tax=Acinetobacter sp. TaxID=472 RepID=UPI002FCB451D
MQNGVRKAKRLYGESAAPQDAFLAAHLKRPAFILHELFFSRGLRMHAGIKKPRHPAGAFPYQLRAALLLCLGILPALILLFLLSCSETSCPAAV